MPTGCEAPASGQGAEAAPTMRSPRRAAARLAMTSQLTTDERGWEQIVREKEKKCVFHGSQ